MIIKVTIKDPTMTINLPPAMNSWKSTLIGVVSAVIGVIQASSDHDWLVAIKDHNVQLMMVVAVLGFVSKDANVTGGTTGQPSTPKALHDANQAPSVTNQPIANSPKDLVPSV
jgi:hypothetical protein